MGNYFSIFGINDYFGVFVVFAKGVDVFDARNGDFVSILVEIVELEGLGKRFEGFLDEIEELLEVLGGLFENVVFVVERDLDWHKFF